MVVFFPYALPLASAGVGGYLYNKHLCRLSWCKKYWTYLHVSICVWHHVFLGTHLQSPASPPIFCRFAIVIWTYFNFGPKVPLECILWYDQRCAAGRLFCPQGRDQNWVSPKLDGLRWFNLLLKPYSQLWLHGVSLYFNLESGLSLASGWNLCCAAISFIASHLSFPSVMDLLCLIGQFHIMAIFQWGDVVGKRSWHDL